MLSSRAPHRKIDIALYFAAHTRHCTKTKLMRLFYLLDFEHFGQTGHSVTDQTYLALTDGPVPAGLHCDLYHPNAGSSILASFLKFDPAQDTEPVLPLRAFCDDHLTPRQLRLMADLCERFGDDLGDALENAVRAPGGPWSVTRQTATGPCDVIPFALALEGSPHREALLAVARDREMYLAAREAEAA